MTNKSTREACVTRYKSRYHSQSSGRRMILIRHRLSDSDAVKVIIVNIWGDRFAVKNKNKTTYGVSTSFTLAQHFSFNSGD